MKNCDAGFCPSDEFGDLVSDKCCKDCDYYSDCIYRCEQNENECGQLILIK